MIYAQVKGGQKLHLAYESGEGKEYHHDVWCNADRRKTMGCYGCSCKYGRRK